MTDVQVERYSRQILLPEVGGRGQARLLAAAVAVGGDGAAARAAALLLGRAGVGTLELSERIGLLPELSPECRIRRQASLPGSSTADLHVGLFEPGAGAPWSPPAPTRPVVVGMLRERRIVVATLVGRPCGRCWLQTLRAEDVDADAADGVPAAAAAGMALGALAAAEALRVLVTAPAHGRLTRVELEQGAVETRDLVGAGCSCCSVPS